MLRNYLLTAWRHMRRQPGYATINILGLAIGLGVCLLIGVYVTHERSYDEYHAQADRTYRLIYAWEQGEDTPRPPRAEFATWGSGAIAPLLEADFPEVEHAVRFSGGHTILLGRGDRSFQEERYYFADSTVFDVFHFPLQQGNPTTALAAPNRIVLTASAAQKYFGDANPMGQTMRLDNERTLTVTGVMADLPSNTHFAFDMLLSMTTFEQFAPDYMFENWGYVDFFTYVLLKDGRQSGSLTAQFPAFVQRHNGDQLDGEAFFLDLEPLTEAYLSPVGGGKQIGPKGNPANLAIFTLIGLFVLGIACINFTNLATARSMERAKEVGVRKAIGARRAPLVGQFMTESVGMALCAMTIAIGLVSFIAPYVETLSDGALAPAQLFRAEAMGALLGLTVLTGLLAGAYPAFVLSGFRPVTVLRGTFSHSQRGRGLRTGLVVVQFVISTLLLVGTFVSRVGVVAAEDNVVALAGVYMRFAAAGIDQRGDRKVRPEVNVIFPSAKQDHDLGDLREIDTMRTDVRVVAEVVPRDEADSLTRDVQMVFQLGANGLQDAAIQADSGNQCFSRAGGGSQVVSHHDRDRVEAAIGIAMLGQQVACGADRNRFERRAVAPVYQAGVGGRVGDRSIQSDFAMPADDSANCRRIGSRHRGKGVARDDLCLLNRRLHAGVGFQRCGGDVHVVVKSDGSLWIKPGGHLYFVRASAAKVSQ